MRIKPLSLPPAYSCTIVSSDGDTSKIWVDPRYRRVDLFPLNRPPTTIITNKLNGLTFKIDLETKVYARFSIPPAKFQAILDTFERGVEWEHTGTENIDGKWFDKYLAWRYDSKSKFPGEVVYVDSESNIRRRTISIDLLGNRQLTTDYKEIVIGTPPKGIFLLPEGLKRVALWRIAI